jgi:hypothetical protein
LTNPHKCVFTLSFDGVICDGAVLVGNDGRVHGVMPGKVPDLTKPEMDAIRGDPAIMREHLERFSEYAVGAMSIAAATSWAPDAPVFPVAAEPALTSANNEGHMKGFFKRVVTNVKAAVEVTAASTGTVLEVRAIGFDGAYARMLKPGYDVVGPIDLWDFTRSFAEQAVFQQLTHDGCALLAD